MTTPTAKVYDFTGAEVGSTTSGFTVVEPGVYAFALSTAGITLPGTYRLIAYGSYGSQRLFSDGPILFEVAQPGDHVTYVGVEELIHYLELEEPVDIAFIKDLAYAATSFIENACRRTFRRKTIPSEVHHITDSQYLRLNEYPVVDVSSVTVDGVAVTEYTVDKRAGVINFDVAQTGEVIVAYVAGVDSVPQDINLAAKKIAAVFWQRRKREGVRSERLLGYGYNVSDDVFADVREILNRYTLVSLG